MIGYEMIFKDICSKIEDGTYPSGDKLPSTNVLASQYGVCKNTVLKAINKLKQSGLIETQYKVGVFVKKGSNSESCNKNYLIPIILPHNYDDRRSDFMKAINEIAKRNNCSVPFYNSNNSVKLQTKILKDMMHINPDCIVIYPVNEFSNLDLFSYFNIKKTPIIFIDKRVIGISGCLVKTDNINSFSYMLNEIIKGGHTKIACAIPYVFASVPEQERFNSFCATLIKNNIPIVSEYLLANQNYRFKYDTIATYYKSGFVKRHFDSVVKKYVKLKDKPTVICCASDADAYNLKKSFISILGQYPKNLIITGFDKTNIESNQGIKYSAFQNFAAIAKAAMELSIQIINGQTLKTDTIIIPPDNFTKD